MRLLTALHRERRDSWRSGRPFSLSPAAGAGDGEPVNGGPAVGERSPLKTPEVERAE